MRLNARSERRSSGTELPSAALKYESMCLDPTEQWLFAGNACGEVHSIDVDRFKVLSRVQANVGIVQAIAAHRRLPFVATLSTDRTVSLLRRDGSTLRPLVSIPLRDIRPSNDSRLIPPVQSTSQALGFHDKFPRLVTRSGNAGLVEIEFGRNGEYSVRWCIRLHDDADLISVRYVRNGDQILSGAIDGQFVMSEGGREIRRWTVGRGANVHWAEHFSGSTYLLASDIRYVARVDVSRRNRPIVGPQFTRDDLEHVTFNKKAKRAFVASFDRSIYEIDTQTCKPIRTVFRAPFKCRWIKTLERAPKILIVQCRNGGLYKVNIDSGKVIAKTKHTPEALWTSAIVGDGSVVLAGEGNSLTMLTARGIETASRAARFGVTKARIKMNSATYTKRMEFSVARRSLILGRTNGDLIEVRMNRGQLGTATTLKAFGNAIRDLAVPPSEPTVYVACESGLVHRIDINSAQILATWESDSKQPVWSIAHNPSRAVLAVAERNGRLFFLDDETLAVISCGPEMGRPKRMKFQDEDTLLYNHRDEVYRFDLREKQASRLVSSVGNTIEDFIWDNDRRYLLCISYTQNILLSDFGSGRILSEVPDQIDYSKGIAWASTSNGYPLDFITYGRSGAAHRFRIHDEKILSMGPLICQ